MRNVYDIVLDSVYRVIFAPCFFHSLSLAKGFAPSQIRPDLVVFKEIYRYHLRHWNLPNLKFNDNEGERAEK